MNIGGGMKGNVTMLGVYDVGRKTRATNLVVFYHFLEVHQFQQLVSNAVAEKSGEMVRPAHRVPWMW